MRVDDGNRAVQGHRLVELVFEHVEVVQTVRVAVPPWSFGAWKRARDAVQVARPGSQCPCRLTWDRNGLLSRWPPKLSHSESPVSSTRPSTPFLPPWNRPQARETVLPVADDLLAFEPAHAKPSSQWCPSVAVAATAPPRRGGAGGERPRAFAHAARRRRQLDAERAQRGWQRLGRELGSRASCRL